MGRMDITRKFIQMGRTRSLRYALRKGGRKYEPPPVEEDKKGKRKRTAADNEDDRDVTADAREHTGRNAGRKEIPRTGEVYDESKLEGANIFEGYLDRCWADETYARAWENWREAGKRKERPAGEEDEGDDTATTTTTTTKPTTTTKKARRK